MDVITTTELRTKTPKVIETLLQGGVIDIIHRSKIVGEIRPKKAEAKVFNAKRFLKLAKKLNLPRRSEKELERNFREHIEKKYVKSLSRH